MKRISSYKLVLVYTFFLVISFSVYAQHPERRGIGTLPLPDVRAFNLEPGLYKPLQLDARRSLFITDVAIVSEFTFADVMEALAEGSPDGSMTKEALFNQWWDTANQGPGLGLGPNCDSETDTAGNATLNGFPLNALALKVHR